MADGCYLLRVDDLVAGYGNRQVLRRVTLHAARGEIVALIGHNGAGKSTLLKAVFGLLPLWQGQICLDGKSINPLNPRSLLRAGVAYVPQGNRVFADFTVKENLEVAGITLSNKVVLKQHIERVLSLFPQLVPRLHQRACTLSGGEKQMLAMSNALVVGPRLLLADEPSLGLAPPLVSEALSEFQKLSRDFGMTVVIVEQKVREVLKIANRVYVLRNGQVTFEGSTATLDDEKLRNLYL